jgi:regulator of nonsense transcripts 1
MHPKLSEFPSNTFYDGNLQNGVTSDDRIYFNVNFPWPNVKKPTFFYHIVGKEEFSASGTSYLNREEADFIETIVKTLLKCTVKPEQIGIITPYEGQRCYIVSRMLKNCASTEIEVSSVDSFQGREKDYIIMSCVRSNNHHGIGFLDDPRRLNVSLTRARYGLILVGNAMALSNHQLWINLLDHYQKMNLLVQGQLGSLKEVSIPLPAPKRYLPEKMVFENTEQVVKDNSNNPNSCNDITITYSIDNHSYYTGYNSSSAGENKTELSNNATKSRFSDFGYINDNEAISHYNKVKNIFMKKPMQLTNNFIKTPYENYVMQYNNISLMGNNNINPMVMGQYMRNMIMFGGIGQNQNLPMFQNMGIYDPKIWSNGANKNLNGGVIYNCYNSYTKAQNSSKHSEKKFVSECEF